MLRTLTALSLLTLATDALAADGAAAGSRLLALTLGLLLIVPAGALAVRLSGGLPRAHALPVAR